MAEVAAIVGLVASITTLVELNVKVLSRLHEFTSKTSVIPESFRPSRGWPLSDDATETVIPAVDNTSQQVAALQTCLSGIFPPDNAPKLKRVLKALKSLAKENIVQQLLDKIDKNIDYLRLYQTTRQVDTGDLILAQLSKLTVASEAASASFGKDKLLSLARASGEELTPHTQSILSNSNRRLLIRFSQLPITAQQKFIAQQEKQLSRFVEQEEAKVLEFLTVFDTHDRLADAGRHRVEGTCTWITDHCDYLEWVYGNRDRLLLVGGPGTGKTVASAYISNDLSNRLGNEDILAVYACSWSVSQTTSAKGILCALAGQIAQRSLASMEKCKKFLERYISDGQLEHDILDLQDLIVEMSLSADVRQIFIVIDGLDECQWEQPNHLMAVVDIPQYARKVKMLITSRPDDLITKALHGYFTLSMDKETMAADLATYTDWALKEAGLANRPEYNLHVIE
ncbi:MAG: hypothetical protein Q9213_003358 [Squamulea squamosa]